MDQDRLRLFEAMTDPVRLSVLEQLRLSTEPLSTAQLSRSIPEASGSLSYHLRVLADVGLVEKIGGVGRGAQWSAGQARFAWTEEDESDPQGQIAVRSLERVLSERREARWRRWLSEKRTDVWPAEWRAADDSFEWVVNLSPHELRTLQDDVRGLMAKYKGHAGTPGDADQGRETVFVSVSMHPFLTSDTAARSGDESR